MQLLFLIRNVNEHSWIFSRTPSTWAYLWAPIDALLHRTGKRSSPLLVPQKPWVCIFLSSSSPPALSSHRLPTVAIVDGHCGSGIAVWCWCIVRRSRVVPEGRRDCSCHDVWCSCDWRACFSCHIWCHGAPGLPDALHAAASNQEQSVLVLCSFVDLSLSPFSSPSLSLSLNSFPWFSCPSFQVPRLSVVRIAGSHAWSV